MKAALRERIKPILPSLYLDYRLYFSAVYQELKSSDHDYSYQKFASDLGFSATTIMHQIVKGYRPLSAKAAAGIAKKLELSKYETRYLLALVGFCNAKSLAAREENFEKLKELKREILPTELDKGLLDYFSEWFHPVIWELIGTKGFQADAKWISERIMPQLSIAQVMDSLRLLENLGFIAREGDGYRQLHNRISTGPQLKGHALMSYHQNMMDHAKRSLIDIRADRRDVSAMTVSVTEEGAKILREMIHAFQQQLLDEAERCGDADQIYQINIQLFPFTR